MTPENQEIIQNVINRLAPKYVFGCYELEDIVQEAWIIAMKILDSWDGIRPLENFMMVSLNNRLKNIPRDKFYRRGTTGKRLEINERKKQLMGKAEEYLDINECDDDNLSTLLNKEEVNLILDQLPYTIRADFNRLANNVSIPNHRKAKVYDTVREIYEKNRPTFD